jgi:hypothetical protein
VEERERKRQLDEEFHRALTGDPGDSPWGLTPDVVWRLRPTRDDIELWLLATHYPEATRRSQLTRGRKGYFTRRLEGIWRACAGSYRSLDVEGRPGYYEVWTTGKFSWDDSPGLGTIWARSTAHAEQVAHLMFDHVAGPDRYYGETGRAQIKVRYIGGSVGEGEEAARARQQGDMEKIQSLLEQARKNRGREDRRAQLLEARLEAIDAVDLAPGGRR